MAWPPSDIPTTNTDVGTDSPPAARADILGLMQGFNLLRNHFSAFMRSLAEAADAPAARTALGASTLGSNVFTAANSLAARDALNAVGRNGDEEIAGIKYLTRGAPVVSDIGFIGFASGAGGTVTQLSSNTADVRINKPTGMINMFSASLAAGASVTFAVLCDRCFANLTIPLVTQVNSSFEVRCVATQTGSFVLRVTNTSGSASTTGLQIMFLLLLASPN